MRSSGVSPSSRLPARIPISRSSAFEAPLSSAMNGWNSRVNRYSGRATKREAVSHRWIAHIFGTCSPIVMCSAVEMR